MTSTNTHYILSVEPAVSYLSLSLITALLSLLRTASALLLGSLRFIIIERISTLRLRSLGLILLLLLVGFPL